jgi:hypothetical protein
VKNNNYILFFSFFLSLFFWAGLSPMLNSTEYEHGEEEGEEGDK